MQPVKYAVCLLSVCSAMTAPAVVESLSLDLTRHSPSEVSLRPKRVGALKPSE